MDNRYHGSGHRQGNRDRWGNRGRQDEQFRSDSDEQFGETRWHGQGGDRWQSGSEFDRGYGMSTSYRPDNFERGGSGYRSDSSSLDDYDNAGLASSYGRSYGSSGGTGGQTRADRFSPSRAMQGYGDRAPDGSRYGSGMGSSHGRGGTHIPPRGYDPDERGFFDRASDEVMSWFGDDDAARRRQMDQREDHRGRGPANYSRSSERIQEEVCERLMRDPHVDASKITVTCSDNEITLDGTVDSRSAKRRAEDVADDVSGVKHVQNNLRVESRETYYGQSGSASEG